VPRDGAGWIDVSAAGRVAAGLRRGAAARAYRADIIVEESVLLEIKSIEQILPVHEAQLLTYLRLSGFGVGLLLNFSSTLLKNGLRRFVQTSSPRPP
jgi:GxxExxY protein